MQLNAKMAAELHCPRWAELPNIPLYMDQVTLVLESALCLFLDGQEKAVTPTMINNYVKQKLIAPPEKKKYNREHLAVLVVISLLKKVLSMQEISSLISLMGEHYGLPAAYDLFCERLERALCQSFSPDGLSIKALGDPYDVMLNASVLALTGKLIVQSSLPENG